MIFAYVDHALPPHWPGIETFRTPATTITEADEKFAAYFKQQPAKLPHIGCQVTKSTRYTSFPSNQRHRFITSQLPVPIRWTEATANRACQGMLNTFQARGPRGIVTVYIGERGILWRIGQPFIEQYGQVGICERGKEPKWISVNALPHERLPTLAQYANRYLCSDVVANSLYAEELYKSITPMINLDAATGEPLVREMVYEINEAFVFLRKMLRSVQCYRSVVYLIANYIIMRNRISKEIINEPETI